MMLAAYFLILPVNACLYGQAPSERQYVALPLACATFDAKSQ
jgi:hypothetical protein